MEEWKEVRLGDIVEILDAKRVPLSSMQRQAMKGSYPYYGAQNIIDYVNDYIFDGEFLILAEDGENLKSRKSPIAQIVKGKFWLNNHAHILRENGNADLYFLNAIINSSDISAYITGSAQPKLNQENMSKIKISLPPLSVQKKIAGILSALDENIETNRKINARLEELAQAIFKSWFIDFTPFGGQMPQDWEECNLEDVLIVKYGKDHKNLSDGPFPVYGSGGIMRSVDKPIYEKESVLIPRKGTLNNIIYVDDPFWSVDTMFFTEMKKKNLAKYIFFLLKRFDFQSMNSGSAIPSMTRSILYNLRLNLPAERILEKFESIINPFFLKIKYLQKESARLAELRDTLLPKLMSGEIKV